MRTVLLLAVLLALLLPPVAVRADDESPGARFDTTVAGFPKPTAAKGFDVSGEVRKAETLIGRFRVSARPAGLPDTAEGPLHWLLESNFSAAFEDATIKEEEKAYVTAALAPVQGVKKRTDPWGETIEYAWRRVEDTFEVKMKSDVRDPRSKQAAVEGSSITGLAGLVLFARLAPTVDVTYETRTFDPAWNYLQAEQPFTRTTISLAISKSWREQVMRLVTFAYRDSKMVVACAPETSKLGGLEIYSRGHLNLVLLPVPGADAQAPDEDWFAVPSKTPRGCALRVALAFAAADVSIFEKVIHWPTLKKNMKAQISGSMTEEAFKKAILAQFEANKQAGSAPADAEAALRKQSDGFRVEARGENGAVITFPKETYGDMRVEVGRVDGAWYLVRLPGN